MSVYARRYHAVVANPPYIVAESAEVRYACRARYASAHRRFGLGAPFTERMFELLVPGGYVAQITSNAFMKREYGRPLVERVLPHYDLTHVIDTSGAYIPGHGTPTVILAARNRPPSGAGVLAVQARRGEPETPKGHVGRVWNSIRRGLGLPEESAPSGPQPIGLVWAKALAPAARELARELRGDVDGMTGDEMKREEAAAASCAAAWLTTAAALRGLDLCRPSFGAAPSPDGEHLAASFEGVARAVPFSRWFAPGGVNPCFERPLSDAQSARVRAAVAAVVDPAAIPAEQAGRTDWIGDLYQGLDDAARERHAFCQTPWFVGRLLCELAVDPALAEFGPGAAVLDPACGTGHLLCEAFARLYRARSPRGCGCPWGACRACATAALSQVAGGDINPVAAAVAEWRLMLAWVDAARPRTLSAVPDDLPINVEVADALTACRSEGRVDHAKAHPQPAPAARREPDARGQFSLFGGSP